MRLPVTTASCHNGVQAAMMKVIKLMSIAKTLNNAKMSSWLVVHIEGTLGLLGGRSWAQAVHAHVVSRVQVAHCLSRVPSCCSG